MSWYYEPEEESIYRLVPQEVREADKPPMHKSCHKGTLAPSYSTFGTQGLNRLQANCHGEDVTDSPRKRKPAATMGTVGVHPHPTHFLKKRQGGGGGAGDTANHSGGASLPPVRKPPGVATEKKTGVPKRTEKPVMGLVTQKDFVISNAVDNIMMEPKRPKAAPVRYTQTKTFGKPPAYLQKIKQSVHDEYEHAMSANASNRNANSMRQMTDEERNDLIAQLTEKWEAAHSQYLRLTFSLDTRHKIQRKEAIEAELEQLEKAIAKLSKKLIYVFPDQQPGYSHNSSVVC